MNHTHRLEAIVDRPEAALEKHAAVARERTRWRLPETLR